MNKKNNFIQNVKCNGFKNFENIYRIRRSFPLQVETKTK